MTSNVRFGDETGKLAPLTVHTNLITPTRQNPPLRLRNFCAGCIYILIHTPVPPLVVLKPTAPIRVAYTSQ